MTGINRTGSPLIALVAILVAGSIDTSAQKTPEPRPSIKIDAVAPRPDDVSTLDGIMKAFYETTSGPAGQARQWSRDKTLYMPGIMFVQTGLRKKDNKPYAFATDYQTFVDLSNDEMVKEGFFEREVNRITRKYGNMVHVFSVYESRTKADGPVIERGVNSVDLYFDGSRWWIASVLWHSEQPGDPIPSDFLSK